jgi:hypothetical protein
MMSNEVDTYKEEKIRLAAPVVAVDKVLLATKLKWFYLWTL